MKKPVYLYQAVLIEGTEYAPGDHELEAEMVEKLIKLEIATAKEQKQEPIDPALPVEEIVPAEVAIAEDNAQGIEEVEKPKRGRPKKSEQEETE